MSLKAKISAMEGERVTLSFEDGQTLVVPTSSVEGVLKVGQEAALVVVGIGSEDAGRKKMAQDLLNELLKA